MEIYQLKVFLHVARYLSFTEAANALNLTQPAVSAKIKSLEAEVGAPLFYRLGRKVQLTEVGEFLVEKSASLIEREEKLKQSLEEFKKGGSGVLKIGCTSAISEGWISPVIYQYRQHYPDIEVKQAILESGEHLYESIVGNTIDLAISEYQVKLNPELACEPIATVNYSLLVSTNHPLAYKKWLSIKDLVEQSWVLGSERFASSAVFLRRIAELGLSIDEFSTVETVSTVSLMREFMLTGNFLGFASNLEFQAEVDSGLCCRIPLQEFAFDAPLFMALPAKLARILEREKTKTRKQQVKSPVQKFIDVLDCGNSANSKQKLSAIPKLLPIYIDGKSRSNSKAQMTLSIGVQNSIVSAASGGSIVKQLGLMEHYLPKTGQFSTTDINILWNNYTSGMPIVDALHAGEIDIGILGDYPLLLSAAKSSAEDDLSRRTELVSFVSINPDGNRNAAVVPTRSPIQEIDDLIGRRIAIPFGSAAHGMTQRVLHRLDLQNDVELVPLDGSLSHRFEPQSRNIVGYAHFSPYPEIAKHKGGWRYLFDGHLTGLPAFYGVVVRRSFASQYPDLIRSYLKALNAAQYWQLHVSNSLKLIGQWTHNNPHIVAEILGDGEQQNLEELYIPDSRIRADWLKEHITEFQSIEGHSAFRHIDLNNWINTEFWMAAKSDP